MLRSTRFFNFLITLSAFVIFFTSCSHGKIDYNNRTPDCLKINDPSFDDTLGIPSEEKLSELKNRNNRIFETVKTATLSNTSSNKIINFTIKIEANKNSPNPTSRTEIVKLNPGEEYELGCTKSVSYLVDKSDKTIRLDSLEVTEYNYSIVGEVVLKK